MTIDLYIPDPDSQFKLMECRDCGAETIGYEQEEGRHRVRCPECGSVTRWRECRHDAQIEWNSRHERYK